MKMVKNLTVANIKKIEGMVRREDLDFADDGNRFRGFEYKGMPITTLRSGDTTYLSIRVDYLNNDFTWREWRKTEEYNLCDEFNGVSEFDLDKLVENLEKVIAKVEDLNIEALKEEINTDEVEEAIAKEIKMAEEIVEDFKANFKWYNVESYELKMYVDCLKATEKYIARAKVKNIKALDNRAKKELVERLNEYGYVEFRKNDFYLEKMKEALTK